MSFRTNSDSAIKDVVLPQWQETLIESIFNLIKSNYIFSNTVEQIAFKNMLHENFVRINTEFPTADKEKFCNEVNNVLKLIDPHLILQHDPSQIADHLEHKRIIDDPRKNNCAKFMLDGLDPPKSWFEKFEKENYGFVVTPQSSIPPTIGYVKINDFLDPRDGLGHLAQKKAFEILNNLREKKAIIIDLRDSHGGSPEMVEFMISYLLTEADKAKIKDGVYNTIYDQSTEKLKEYSVKPTEFNLNVPIYVLVNEQTFSAAEEFSYDLQQLNKNVLKDNRFLIVGQTTHGGAHAMTGFPLVNVNADSHEINKEYFLWVPTRTTINPYTATNWEDGPKKEARKPGVQADIEIPKEKNALDFAVSHLKPIISHEASKPLVSSQSMFSKPKKHTGSEAKKQEGLDVTDEEMAKHAFGQGSNTAKKLSK